MANRRVVLTGLGTVNPLGHGVEEFWRNLLACKSGIRPIERFDTTGFASRIGGEVQNWATIPSELIDPHEAKRMDRFAQFAVAAAIEAVNDSGLDFANEVPDRCGVIVGTGIGGLQELEDQHKRMLDRGPGGVSPFTVPKLMGNAASAYLHRLAVERAELLHRHRLCVRRKRRRRGLSHDPAGRGRRDHHGRQRGGPHADRAGELLRIEGPVHPKRRPDRGLQAL